MGRRKKGDPVHGWVILDKPKGMTSTQGVAAVRRIFDAQKAGHAGTLDPLATGILAIALGEATKTVPYAMDADKVYRFTASWGESRDSEARGEQVAADGRVTILVGRQGHGRRRLDDAVRVEHWSPFHVAGTSISYRAPGPNAPSWWACAVTIAVPAPNTPSTRTPHHDD